MNPSFLSAQVAVTVNAYDTPDAIREVQLSMANPHFVTKDSSLSKRNRVFLGDLKPLDDLKPRCDLLNTEAIRQYNLHLE